MYVSMSVCLCVCVLLVYVCTSVYVCVLCVGCSDWCGGSCKGCRYSGVCSAPPGEGGKAGLHSAGVNVLWFHWPLSRSKCTYIHMCFCVLCFLLQFVGGICQKLKDHVKEGAFAISLIKVSSLGIDGLRKVCMVHTELCTLGCVCAWCRVSMPATVVSSWCPMGSGTHLALMCLFWWGQTLLTKWRRRCFVRLPSVGCVCSTACVVWCGLVTYVWCGVVYWSVHYIVHCMFCVTTTPTYIHTYTSSLCMGKARLLTFC